MWWFRTSRLSIKNCLSQVRTSMRVLSRGSRIWVPRTLTSTQTSLPSSQNPEPSPQPKTLYPKTSTLYSQPKTLYPLPSKKNSTLYPQLKPLNPLQRTLSEPPPHFPNPLNHPVDLSRLALRHESLNSLVQIA